MPKEPQHRCWVEIHLDAFERNLKRIQASLPQGVRYIAVVKADAYGHGMPQIVRRLMQCGVDSFAVANTREAAVIREMGAGWPILILGPILPEEATDLVRDDLTATVSDLSEAKQLNALAQSHTATLKVHLKIDTGMGRGVCIRTPRTLQGHPIHARTPPRRHLHPFFQRRFRSHHGNTTPAIP